MSEVKLKVRDKEKFRTVAAVYMVLVKNGLLLLAKRANTGYADGKYVLPPLPYAYDALEPMLDEKTVRIHHDKHHAAYVAGANAAAEKLREIADGKLDASATTN